MVYFFFILTGLALILLQSLVLVLFVPSGMLYDLLIPLVVFLSLFYPNGKSLLLLLFLGFVMDDITGGATGVYMLSYFWIFAGIQLAVYFFQKDSPVLMASAVVLGVLLESGLVFFVAVLSGNAPAVEVDMAGIITGRLIAAGVTGPLLLGVFKSLYNNMAISPDIS